MRIETNIPIPAFDNPRWHETFSQMETGDSFVVEGGETQITRCRVAASQYGRLHQMKFSVRQHEGLTRCWRIA